MVSNLTQTEEVPSHVNVLGSFFVDHLPVEVLLVLCYVSRRHEPGHPLETYAVGELLVLKQDLTGVCVDYLLLDVAWVENDIAPPVVKPAHDTGIALSKVFLSLAMSMLPLSFQKSKHLGHRKMSRR